MGVLTIGRVGLDVSMNDPSEMSESRSIDSREFVLRGFLRSDSLANTKYLRTALLEQQGQVVACTYDIDDHFDAFYLLADSSIETMETSYLRRGLFLFEKNRHDFLGPAMQVGKPPALRIHDDAVHVRCAQTAIAVRITWIGDAGKIVPLMVHSHKVRAQVFGQLVSGANGIPAGAD